MWLRGDRPPPEQRARKERELIAFRNRDRNRLVKLKGYKVGARNRTHMPISPTSYHWGEAPYVPVFYGRDRELKELKQAILEERCHLIALTGMGGVGKTTLAVKLAREISIEFDRVFWRSLRSASPFRTFLGEAIAALKTESPPAEPIDAERAIERLLECLRESRCLVVFDDMEVLFDKGQLAGNYAEDFTDYGRLIRRIAQEKHQSCTIAIASEKLAELAALEGPKVRWLPVGGSQEIAAQILQEKGLQDSQDLQAFIERYGGNPLAIKIVSSVVRVLYGGDVASFIRDSVFLDDNLNLLLEEQFERLSAEEQEAMYWLALESEPLSLDLTFPAKSYKSLTVRVSETTFILDN